eukprot:TRINITY_DN16229_c0_g1_i1.p1 TRINITY_DN16229_c0_g1~~TRINITY_DN16229_c0_g1_i1.p1  ORF type:complete len:308 (-),score=71.11 TRINITY_DN16229_c0_g1_i1:313-1236(-)
MASGATMQSPTFGAPTSPPTTAADASSPKSIASTVSTWTEKAAKLWRAIPFAIVVVVGIGAIAACCAGLALRLWLTAIVAAMISILCRFVYLLQWEHLELTQELLAGATLPIVVQPPAVVKKASAPATRLTAAEAVGPVSELDLTGFAGSLGFGGRSGQVALDVGGEEQVASSGTGTGLRKLQQHALAKEYLLVCSALTAYRNAFGLLPEPETPKAPAVPSLNMADINAADADRAKTPRSPCGLGSPGAPKRADADLKPTSPGGYAKMSENPPVEPWRPRSFRREEANECQVEEERPRSTFALFGGR